MAAMKQCANTQPHEYHGREIPVPSAPLGFHYYVCEGVADSAEEGETNECEIQIEGLARAIAAQKHPESALSIAISPHEIARALYLMGWSPREALKAYIDAKGPLYDPAERITDKEPDA